MTARPYAADTTVTPERTRTELEKLLQAHGASGFSYAWQDSTARVEFLIGGRHVRLTVPLPPASGFEFTATRQRRTAASAKAAHEKALRARWRALLLIVRAKLEAIATGVVDFDSEWLPYLVLPDGRTVAEVAVPEVVAAYSTGVTPQLLPPQRRELGQ